MFDIAWNLPSSADVRMTVCRLLLTAGASSTERAPKQGWLFAG
jgi:hypothetical protein